MSRIVICAREWSTSTGRYARRLIENLERVDTVNDYQILLKPADMDSYQPTNPRFTKIACPYKEYTFAEQLGLKKQLESLRPDLVHFTMVQQPAWYSGKVVTTMQDLTTIRFRNPAKNPLVFWYKQQVYKWLNKRVAHKSTAIITPTAFVRGDIVGYTGVPSEKITVTLEAADLISVEPEQINGLADKQFLFYIGRPTPHKNLPRLIEAFQILQVDRPDLVLVLGGKTDENYQRIADLVVEKHIKNVVFTDIISEGQLRWLYEHCAAYVFPSLSEGFGLPGLEAMMHGAPVVSSDATCLPEVYGDAAAYFNPGRVDDMAKKIAEVLDNPEYRHALTEKGRQQARQYSWQRMAEQTLAVYKQVLGTK